MRRPSHSTGKECRIGEGLRSEEKVENGTLEGERKNCRLRICESDKIKNHFLYAKNKRKSKYSVSVKSKLHA